MSVRLPYGVDDDVIFTTLFSSKPNPQLDARGQTQWAPRDTLSYIYPWHLSVGQLGLKAVVIHDGLGESLIRQHETDCLRFVHHEPARYSLNDERYLALDRILDENRFRRVMLTDGSDLLVKRNPFDFMEDARALYFGTDEPSQPRIRDNPWCLSKLGQLMEVGAAVIDVDESFLDFHYVNAGVMGGDYELVKKFVRLLVLVFEAIDSDRNNNMLAINYLLWKYGLPHFKGQPFTSPFKRHELHGDYYIVHK